jgi:hypothetical protein
MTASESAHADGDVGFQIMMETWRIQYQTTQGMNARISALGAIAGVLLGLLLSGAGDGTPALPTVLGVAASSIAITCLVIASRTRWAPVQPTAAAVLDLHAREGSAYVSNLVCGNKVLLRHKARWIDRAAAFTLVALLTLAIERLF